MADRIGDGSCGDQFNRSITNILNGDKAIDMLTRPDKANISRTRRDNQVTSQFQKAGCGRPDGQPWPAWFNHVPIERVRVATGSKDFGMYNHQAGICNWQDRYWYVFSNGADNEEAPGQRTMLTSSQDLVSWSNPTCVALGDPKDDMWRNTGGVMGYEDRLVVFVQTKTGHSTARKPGMRANEEARAARKVEVLLSSQSKD